VSGTADTKSVEPEAASGSLGPVGEASEQGEGWKKEGAPQSGWGQGRLPRTGRPKARREGQVGQEKVEEGIPGRENSMCKGPGAGALSVFEQSGHGRWWWFAVRPKRSPRRAGPHSSGRQAFMGKFEASSK
jgi:hypothetical protein